MRGLAESPLRQQLAVAALALIGGFLWFAVWGPPHGVRDLPDDIEFLAACVGFLLLAGEIYFFTLWLSRRRPFVRTTLGKFTFWAGIVSCLALFTGFLLGWLALLLAPAGVVAGIVTVTKEVRARSGNDHRNLIGMILCAGALVFLAA